MKSVLISIQPKWCEKIVNGNKTIEVRKSAPKCDVPFKCYIYCTASNVHGALVVGGGEAKLIHCCNYKSAIPIGGVIGNGKVIGEFVCDWIKEINPSCDINGCVNQYIHGYPAILGEDDCLSFNEMKAYLGNKKGYDWHISDLVIYDKPRELKEFGLNRAPQSWCYVEVENA